MASDCPHYSAQQSVVASNTEKTPSGSFGNAQISDDPPRNLKLELSRKKFRVLNTVCLFFCILGGIFWSIGNFVFPQCPHHTHSRSSNSHNSHDVLASTAFSEEICHQPALLSPAEANYSLFDTFEFRNWSLATLQAAIRVPTESFDDLKPVGQDPRWEIFFQFAKVLKDSFPLIDKHLKLERINTHGLVYTWEGSDSSLKPTIFMAHQDVVPVLPDSRSLWTHDPYSAFFDGTNIWGRGTSDMKGTLVATMEAIETLLKYHSEGSDKIFKPRRTIILAFGFDEEISGNYGAAYIAKFLKDRYGPDGINSIVDEGGLGVVKTKDVFFALPGVSEKGMLDLEITIHTPGGHSSLPPDHTGIGILSALAVEMENTPFDSQLTTKNPIYRYLQCLAVNSHVLPEEFKQAILDAGTSQKANKIVTSALAAEKATHYMISTSQALDIVHGGLKVNALPESVTLVANFRISTEESVDSTRNKVIANTKKIAEKYGVGLLLNRTVTTYNELGSAQYNHLDMNEQGEIINSVLPKTDKGYFVISDFGTFIEPAPLTPTNGEAWETFAGTVRHVFEKHAGPIVDPIAGSNSESFDAEPLENKPVIVAPALMVANTDTKHYWSLTKNIYRFSPTRLTDTTMNRIHTVDEYIPLDVQIEAIKFFYSYILNL